MKKIKTKILLGFGVTTTLVTMGSVILSCGNSNSIPSRSELNSAISKITPKMVADYVMTQTGFIPSATVDVPTAAPSTTLNNATLNHVSGLTITISNWVANSTLGSVTFDAFIFENALMPKNITGVTYGGWNTTDQTQLNAVTAKMVADYVKGQPDFIPSSDLDVPTSTPHPTLTDVVLNDVHGLTITILNWTPDNILGSVTFDVGIYKPNLTSKNLTGVTYDGWIIDNQKTLNAVTPKMVADYVRIQTGFIPSATIDAPTTAPSLTLTHAILNNLTGLTITISNWLPDVPLGSVTFDVSISRPDLRPKNIIGVTYHGWKTDQNRLDAATADMVADYVKQQKGFIPSFNIDALSSMPSSVLINVNLNNVDGLTIKISNWKPNYFDGSVTFDVNISKDQLSAKNILGVTYKGFKVRGTVINDGNAAVTEDKLWSFDDSTKTLNIFEGVTEIDTSSGVDWGWHDVDNVAKINFPDSLKTIGDGAFANTVSDNINLITFPKNIISIGKDAFVKLSKDALRLTFLGDIPGTGTPARPNLNIGSNAFAGLTISQINDQSWKDWAQNHCPEAFQQM